MQLKQKTDEYNEFLERMKSQERDLEVREKQQLSQKHREDILKKKADIVEKKQ